jgi:uncharacterized membrane protein YbaN (DUF454 family)
MRRWLLLLVGCGSLGLGVLGVFLPLLPTTPFLLLSSYCFVHSSPRLNRWLLQHPWLGPFLRDWEQQRGVRRSVKVAALLMVLGVVASSWWFGSLPVALKWATTGFSAVGLFVVWRLPVVTGRLVSAIALPTPTDACRDCPVA